STSLPITFQRRGRRERQERLEDAETSWIRPTKSRLVIPFLTTASSPFVLYALCVNPFRSLLDDLGHGAGAHGAAAFPDRDAQPLLHRDRRDQVHAHLRVVPRHHHLHPLRQRRHPRHVRRPEVELRPVAREEGRVPAPPPLRSP